MALMKWESPSGLISDPLTGAETYAASTWSSNEFSFPVTPRAVYFQTTQGNDTGTVEVVFYNDSNSDAVTLPVKNLDLLPWRIKTIKASTDIANIFIFS